jgi:hypothetical protein
MREEANMFRSGEKLGICALLINGANSGRNGPIVLGNLRSIR